MKHLKYILYTILLMLAFISCSDDINQKADVYKVPKNNYVIISDGKRFQDPNASIGKPNNNKQSQNRANQFNYELPKRWLIQKPRQFRDLNIGFTEDPNAACYLTILTNNGGGILPNINRWKGEFNLPAISEDDLKDISKISFFNQQVPLIILSGNYKNKHEDWAMLACFFTNGSKAFTLKFVGPTNLIADQKANFTKFAQSIKEKIK